MLARLWYGSSVRLCVFDLDHTLLSGDSDMLWCDFLIDEGVLDASFRERNADLFDRTFPALLRHYTPERLYFSAARAEFIEPDLEPLP